MTNDSPVAPTDIQIRKNKINCAVSCSDIDINGFFPLQQHCAHTGFYLIAAKDKHACQVIYQMGKVGFSNRDSVTLHHLH